MSDGVVDTELGAYRGVRDGHVWRFRGIRYAAAPVGDLRWRSPQPPEPHAGVVDATEYGHISVQPPPSPLSSITGDPTDHDEDCLFLNVYTPGMDGARRAVMVWIHGGGMEAGSSGSALYDGTHLAGATDSVVVSVNYRLGALGFLAHPQLADETAGGAWANWGLMDQIAALRWVRENIEGFGGDPANICVFGESAGSMSVAALLAVPAARGLFARAICESGPPVALGPEKAMVVVEKFLAALEMQELSRESLSTIPAERILAAQMQAGSVFGSAIGLAFLPVVDGVSMERDPMEAHMAGQTASVPLIAGTNRDEMKMFLAMVPWLAEADDATLAKMAERLPGGVISSERKHPSEMLAAYRGVLGPDVPSLQVWSVLLGDWMFRVPTMRMAEAHAKVQERTFAYRFDWETTFLGGILGACHGLEIPFVFGTLTNRLIGPFAGAGQEGAEELAHVMQRSWAAFAAKGDPSTDLLEAWDPYESERRATMVFGGTAGGFRSGMMVDAPAEELRRLWD